MSRNSISPLIPRSISSTEDLISVINDLRTALASNVHSLGIDLPQIAVVGGQSAGKSSVLESFVGKDFLPRGSGIVTRRPLIIQMHHADGMEWAEFLHIGNKQFRDFNEVRREIQAETNREVGKNQSISKNPIYLRIYSSHVLDLTLIDLPGLTKVPTGDQPDDIEKQIKDMIHDYIKQENTIILAVTPANQDLANSDALKLSKSVDPGGKRTIGVLTKLDLMDEGTNALDIFEGRLCPLRKGYVGLVNRSQKDIDDNKTIDDAKTKEKQFFLNSPYRHLMDKMGSHYLQQHLSKELMQHIRNKLPYVLSSLEDKKQDIEHQLLALQHRNDGKVSKMGLLYKLIGLFVRDVAASLEGNTIDVAADTPQAGYEINRTLHGEIYSILVAVETEPVDEIISYALTNLSGYHGGIFPHQLAFNISVKRIVAKYQAPVKHGVNIIKNIVLGCVQECARNHLEIYPKLHRSILSIVREVIGKKAELTNDHLNCYLEAHQAFINIKHPNFLPEISLFSQEIRFVPNGVIPIPETDYYDYLAPRSASELEAISTSSVDLNEKKYGSKTTSPKSNAIELKTNGVDTLRNNKTTNSWGMKKMFKTKSKITEITDSVKEDPMIQDNTVILAKMVRAYMKVINTAVIDITPKYIILNLIQGTIEFIKLELEANIFESRETNSDKLDLLTLDENKQNKIDELTNMEASVGKAIELVKNIALPN